MMHIKDIVYETTGLDGGPIELPGVKIECPECNEFHEASKWCAYDTYCESCGGHPILSCPNGHYVDPYNGDVEKFNTAPE